MYMYIDIHTTCTMYIHIHSSTQLSALKFEVMDELKFARAAPEDKKNIRLNNVRHDV